MRVLLVTLAGLLVLAPLPHTASATGSAPPARRESPRLVVLRDTGVIRDDLPVLEVHGNAEEVVRVLSRGFTSMMMDLYRREQAYLSGKEGTPIEPAYLLLSQNEGGFARSGFFLGETEKREAGYVDLREGQQTAGRFGALDQIFPHELAHVILRQLAGPPPPSGSNQIHAVGLQTDPGYAFDEGFAEHFQIMVVDDPNVDPWTRSLTFDFGAGSRAYVTLLQYRDELAAPWAPLTRRRMTFPLWYSGLEQVLRYHAVKANAFARRPWIPNQLLSGDDPYRAYLLENILPGEPEDPPKAFRRMIATEGVISSFFYEWAASESLKDSYRDESFYAQFATTANEVGGLENVYLKLFHVFYEHKPHDVLELIEAYEETFPDEAAAVERVVDNSFLGEERVAAPQIWLANPAFQTGTSLYDQFRGQPRTHTFDLNAASEVDLVSVRGVDRILADMIRFQSPYASVEDLAAVPGVSAAIVDEFLSMERAMEDLRSSTQEIESGPSLNDILRAYYWRLFAFLTPAVLLAALLYWLTRWLLDVREDQDAVANEPSSSLSADDALDLSVSAEMVDTSSLSRPPWFRILLNGLAATLVGTLGAASWDAVPFLLSLLAVTAWLGLPAAAWAFWTSGTLRQAVAVLAAWLAAALPAAVLFTPLP
jgi:hypothetical protein